MSIFQKYLKKSSLIRVAQREFNRIIKRPSLGIVTLVVPVVLFVLLSMIYQHHVISNMDIAVFDADSSQLSRSFINSLDATKSVAITDQVNSVEEIRQLMLTGKSQGGIYIPAGFQNKIKSNKQATVVAFKNGSNIVISNTIYKEVQSVAATFAAGKTIKQYQAKGLNKTAAIERALPISVQISSIANPGYNYANYLLPGLLPMILVLCIVLAAVLVINAEFVEGTIDELVQAADSKTGALVFGKSLPYILIHSVNALIMFFIIYPIFNVPTDHISVAYFMFFIALIAAGFALGIAISALVHDPLLASDVGLFLTAPSLIFCGYTFPLWGMPKFDMLFAQILPFTHYIEGMMRYYQFGGGAELLKPYFWKLGLFIIPCFSMAYFVTSRRLAKNSAVKRTIASS